MKGKVILVTLLALLLLASPILGACAKKPAPPEEAKVVKIGRIDDITGATAGSSMPTTIAIEDYVRSVNEDKGGLEYVDPATKKAKKVKIEMVWEDARFDMKLALEAFKRQIDAGVVASLPINSPYLAAVQPLLPQYQIPVTSVSAPPSTVWGPGWEWVFQTTAPVPSHYAAFLDWALSNWKESRPMRIAIVYPDNTFGQGPMEGFPQYAKQKGVEVVASVIVPMNPVDVSAELTKVKAANPDWVFDTAVAPSAAVILKDAARVGLKTNWIHSYVCPLNDLIRFAGAELAEGSYQINAFGPIYLEPLEPGVQAVIDRYHKYRKLGEMPPGMPSSAVAIVAPMLEGIRIALEKVGYEKLTGAAIREGLENIKNFETGGVTGKISFTSQEHVGGKQVMITQVKNGKPVKVKDWFDVPNMRPIWEQNFLKK